MKYKRGALLYISYLTEIKYYVSTLKLWLWLWLPTDIKDVGTKVPKFYYQPKKVGYYVQIAHYFFYSKWVYFKSTIVLEHVWIKTKYVLYTKISWEKSILTIYWKI